MRNQCQTKRNAEAPPHSRHGTPFLPPPPPRAPDPPLRALYRYHPVTPPGPADTPPCQRTPSPEFESPRTYLSPRVFTKQSATAVQSAPPQAPDGAGDLRGLSSLIRH